MGTINKKQPTSWDQFTNTGGGAIFFLILAGLGIAFPPLLIAYAIVGVIWLLGKLAPEPTNVPHAVPDGRGTYDVFDGSGVLRFSGVRETDIKRTFKALK